MTIVHLIVGLGGGGAEHLVLELARKSKSLNIKTIVISVTSVNTIEFKFKNNDIEIYYLNISKISQFWNGLNRLKQILKTEENMNFHCHMFHALIIGLFYNLYVNKTTIVFTLHNTIVPEWYRRMILFLTKPCRAADINFSQGVKKWYLRNSIVIPNGVDFSLFKCEPKTYDAKKDIFNFLFLGRIEEQKNPFILIELAKSLLKKNEVNFIINLAGDGSLRFQLEEKILTNNLQNHIKILGFQNHTKKLFECSHCLILPSLWEGLPISLIEASAAKLPIITTPVGSIPDFFTPKNTEISELNNFANTMLKVIKNYETALNKADQLYEDNKSIFDINSVFEQHLKVYKTVLKH